MTRCTYDPEPLVGVPLGMHHCPGCGCMVIAGLPHPPCDPWCDQYNEADKAAHEHMDRELKRLAGDETS